ncbi:MAG TPA: hypothetical protein VFK80_01290 [Limnochordia bacterium]|nr:hypothetical protein [Limnochordia bacterium]
MAERDVKLPAQIKDVISYEDDVFAWVYLDHVDRLLRYEAYVLGYDDAGKPTTLALVIEEGTLDEYAVAAAAEIYGESIETWKVLGKIGAGAPTGGNHVAVSTYPRISTEQVEQLHALFEYHEEELKRRNRARWSKRLKALGYDIVPSL